MTISEAADVHETSIHELANASRAAFAMLKLTRAGEVPASAADLAREAEVAESDVIGLAQRWLRVDERNGLANLDQSPAGPSRYRVEIADREISSGGGCSVDTFLLTLATGLPVHVEATCPATGTHVTVDLSPETVEALDPPGAVVALIDLGAIRLSGREQVDALICSQQPFFALADAASDWLAAHPGGRIFGVREYLEQARGDVRRLQGRGEST
jgi:alkylmercury lyase